MGPLESIYGVGSKRWPNASGTAPAFGDGVVAEARRERDHSSADSEAREERERTRLVRRRDVRSPPLECCLKLTESVRS